MKFKIFHFLALFILVLTALTSSVQAQLDRTFGNNGVTSHHIFNNDKPIDSYLLPDGKILVVIEGSNVYSNPQIFKYFFLRFNSDGTFDETYGNEGVVEIRLPNLPFTNPRMTASARQTDGKIFLVGAGAVLRFNENGTLDTSFSEDGIHTPNVDQNATETLVDIVQQPDGRIVAAGMLNDGSASPNPNRVFFVRYEQNGLLDPTFGDQIGFIINKVAYPAFSKIALQSDGRIIIVPEKEILRSNMFYEGAIQRFNSNGTVDSGFAPIHYAGNKLRSFKLLADDSFIVAENNFFTDNRYRTHSDMTISRFTSNGILDLNFGTNGKTNIDVTSAMSDDAIAFAQQGDGKIIISAGTNIEPNRSSYSGMNLSQIRLNTDGSLNGRFLATNLAPFVPRSNTPIPYKGQTLVQPDGKILTVSVKFGDNGTEDLLLTRNTNIPLKTYRFQGLPYSFLNFYYSNASVYRPSNRNWYFNPSSVSVYFGGSEDILTPSDYYGDFRTDVAVFRPSEGNWYIARPDGIPSQDFVRIKWGKTGDIPIPRQYFGGTKADLAVFRPSDGNWYIKNLSDGTHRIVHWGIEGDKPVPADYDGDGLDDIAVWRPSTAMWYIRRSSDGLPTILKFGLSEDIPVQEDYDGDGKADIAVWRPSTGVWYIWRSSDNNYTIYQWGISSDTPTPSDYDGDKKIDIAVWRPENRNWYIFHSNDNSLGQFLFGMTSDIPAQGRR